MNSLLTRGLLAPLVLCCSEIVQAQVIDPPVLPGPERPPRTVHSPVFLQAEKVTVSIHDDLAETQVRHTLRNPNARQEEYEFLFPLPADAVISDFKLTMNGTPVAGEVLDREKARRIYEDIVRRQRDPGLLEFMDTQLVRARIFPVPPQSTTDVELSFVSPVRRLAGMKEFVFPLRRQALCKKPIESLVLDIRLQTTAELKNIFSPSHAVDVSRDGAHRARVSLEAGQVLPKEDFQLLFSEQDGQIGFSLLTHRPLGDEGYFVAFLSPSADPIEKPQPKDVVFVVDTSGSMAGKKIEQVRAALSFCIESLSAEDRFNVISFSTEARAFTERLQTASPEKRNAALEFVKTLEARGGTNIDEALRTALGMRDEERRVFQVLFLTDGLPTIGVTDENSILTNVRQCNAAGTRIFVFGVGDDVNARLLDTLAAESRGSREYVRPGEDLELKVTALFDRVAFPVVTELALRIDGLETRDLYPKELPDLFRGSQLMLVGRYRGAGPRAVHLKGRSGGVAREWIFEATFPEKLLERAYVADFWAARKVGFLLDQIRLHGKNPEVVEEIVRLGKQYGIVTPYTSYLVVEETERLAQARGIPARRFDDSNAFGPGSPAGWAGRGGLRPSDLPPAEEEAKEADRSRERLLRLGTVVTGADAVDDSLYALHLQKKSLGGGTAGDGTSRGFGNQSNPFVRRVDDKVFHLVNSVWIDATFRAEDLPKVTKIAFLSAEYFELLRKDAKIHRFLALGPRVIFAWEGKFYEVAPAAGESGGK